MRKIYSTVFIIFLLINITGCNTSELQKVNAENSDLKLQISKLNTENSELNNQISKLKLENSDLNSKVNQLEQSIVSLNNNYELSKIQNKQVNSNLTIVKEAVSPASAPVNSDVIESKIDGSFEGWEGETIFKLMNGQIWQQASYSYTYHYSYMPEVTIYRSGSGYKMKVEV